VLAEEDASMPWGLEGTWFSHLWCQAPADVDDVLIGTKAGGHAFLQVKAGLSCESSPKSRLGEALAQLVCQFLRFGDQAGRHAWERPLNATRDRLVLVLDHASSAPVKQHLADVITRVAAGLPLADCARSAEEQRTWTIVKDHIDRTWSTMAGSVPADDVLRAWASLVRIQVLSLGQGESDQLAAEDLLRRVLSDPARAGDAWRRLFEYCQGLHSTRSGADRQALVAALAGDGIGLVAPRSYQPSIERLREYSSKTLRVLRKRTAIEIGGHPVHIQRGIAAQLSDKAEQSSLLVIGQPGGGKSATLAEAAQELHDRGHVVVVLAADRLTTADIAQELKLKHPLADVLGNWSGSELGFLFIDGLDAARDSEQALALRQLVQDMFESPGRWKLVVSIRTFDLRWDPDLQEAFRGRPHGQYRNSELHDVCHFEVPSLKPEDLAQIDSQSEVLSLAVKNAQPRLAELLLVPFNLWLLARVVEPGIGAGELESIRTQLQLLDLFWRYRVRSSSEDAFDNEEILRRVCRGMLGERRLRVAASALVRTAGDGEVLARVFHSGVVVPWKTPMGTSTDDFIEFAHNVLFDYAVQRLVLTRDIETLIGAIRSDRDLLLMARPGFAMVMQSLWHETNDRQTFWDASFRLASSEVPAIAKLQGPVVAAELAKTPADLERLCQALESDDVLVRDPGLVCLQHLVSALGAGVGAPLIGADAGPWAQLAARLSSAPKADVIYATRVLLNELCRAV
jgi:hypothetical protein